MSALFEIQSGWMDTNACEFVNAIIDNPDPSCEKDVSQFLFTFIAKDDSVVNAKHAETMRTPMHIACEQGKYQIVSYLMKKGALILGDKNKVTPFHLACKFGSANIINKFRIFGVSVDEPDANKKTPLHYVVESGNIDAVKIVVKIPNININAKEQTGLTPLHIAARNDALTIVEFLIDKGAHINEMCNQDQSPLYHAIMFGEDQSVAIYLINKGANIHHNCSTSKTDVFNLALSRKKFEIAALLIKMGVKTDDALLNAIKYGSIQRLEYLLENGANVNIQDKFMRNPLHWVIVYKNSCEVKVKMLRLLVAKSAYYNLPDKYGKTPEDIIRTTHGDCMWEMLCALKSIIINENIFHKECSCVLLSLKRIIEASVETKMLTSDTKEKLCQFVCKMGVKETSFANVKEELSKLFDEIQIPGEMMDTFDSVKMILVS